MNNELFQSHVACDGSIRRLALGFCDLDLAKGQLLPDRINPSSCNHPASATAMLSLMNSVMRQSPVEQCQIRGVASSLTALQPNRDVGTTEKDERGCIMDVQRGSPRAPRPTTPHHDRALPVLFGCAAPAMQPQPNKPASALPSLTALLSSNSIPKISNLARHLGY